VSPSPHAATTVSLTGKSPTTAQVDAVVVGLCPGTDGPVLAPGADLVDQAVDGSLVEQARAVGATGRAGQVHAIPAGAGLAAQRLVVVGLGAGPEDIGEETLASAAGSAARSLAGCGSALMCLGGETAEAVHSTVVGALLGAYRFTSYRSSVTEPPVAEILVHSTHHRTSAVREAAHRGEVIASAVVRARDWVNTPPQDLPPATLADEAKAAASERGLKVTVLDERRLRRDGYGGIIGVGRGSAHPPRLLRLEHVATPSGDAPRIGLVGKGITFDSGGLSLKPGESMTTMKYDMAGAAAVIAAMLAIAELGPRAHVVAYAALAENMPSGTATRPSDVLTMFDGSTVEVLNTDAEGRLVLADALARAAQDNLDVVVDVATLTGAMTVALGKRTAGVMGAPESWLDEVRAVANSVGEPLWALPIPSEMRAKLDSLVADMANVGDRFGGALQAAAFLREFVPTGVAWAHLDIAGPAWNKDSARGYVPRGGTGTAVRTLVELVQRIGDGTVALPDTGTDSGSGTESNF
jgi:leucyl aminopeptidase